MAGPRKKYNRIKMVLLEQDKTNIWLADRLGVSTTAVSKWCTNRNQPAVETLFNIAEALNVSVCDLLISIRINSAAFSGTSRVE